MDLHIIDTLNEVELESLILQWFGKELDIPVDSRLAVLRNFAPLLPGQNHGDRRMLMALTEDPDSALEHYELMESYSATFLALCLPDLVYTKSSHITVNTLQVKSEFKCNQKEFDAFLTYLQAVGVLSTTDEHSWGEPFETWYFNADFLREYKAVWHTIKVKDSLTLVEQLERRIEYTEDLSYRLETLLSAGGKYSDDLLTAYFEVAEALQTYPVILMDAEKLMLERRGQDVQLEVHGQLS